LSPSGRDLFITATNSHVLAFENISKLSDLMSDHLCRLATGSGLRLRSLFTNRDETLLQAMRPIMVEGITDFVTRPDLLDRALIFVPGRVTERKADAELLADFERRRASIFGALLDHLVVGLRQRPDTRLANPPRMADFALWATACGLDRFEAAYAANRQAAITTLLAHDLLAQALRALVKREWEGTASELLVQLGDAVHIANPRALSDALRRLAPMLLTVGLDIQFDRVSERRGIRIIRQ
jgi:hypothetical protein